MATPIKRIEKDFLLKVLYDEQLPVLLRHAKGEYMLLVERPPKQDIRFKANSALSGIKVGQKLEFFFDYRGQTITFASTVTECKDEFLSVEGPEFLYKNLSRSYSRITTPSDLKVIFSFKGERFNLAFPRTTDYEPATEPQYSDLFDPKDIKELVGQLSVYASEAATGHKLVMFKDKKPETLEERLVSQTGRVLFIPSTASSLPSVDPYPKGRLVTDEFFRRYLESSGIDRLSVDEEANAFLQRKKESDLYSDVYCPIPFQEYVIGYIHLWIDESGKPPFDLSVVDTLTQFAKVLAYSLKIHGYFKGFLRKNEPFQGKVIDVSASGLLFSNASAALAATLLPQSELELRLETPKRAVRTTALIVRRYRDLSTNYFGCRYTDIAPEDLRFLFEYLYGKPFTDADGSLISG